MFRSKAIRWTLVIFGVLLLTNMVVGIIAYRKLDAIDAKYSGIIDTILPFEDEFRTISMQSSRSLAAAIVYKANKVKGVNSPELRELVAQSAALGGNMFKSMGSCTFSTPELRRSYNDALEKRGKWRANLDTYLKLIGEDKQADADSVMKQEVYPTLNSYLTALDDFGDSYEQAYAQMNRRLMSENALNKKIVFGLSMVPLVLLLMIPLSVALLAGVIVAAMILKPMPKPPEDYQDSVHE